MAGKRPGRQAAVFVHRVPTGLDAPHVGVIFIDVMRNGHCGVPSAAVEVYNLGHWADAVFAWVNFSAHALAR